MKQIFFLFLILFEINLSQTSWIRINQLGYLPNDNKVAVLVSKDEMHPIAFSLKDLFTNRIVFTSSSITSYGAYGAFKTTFRLDFSSYAVPGKYTIIVDSIQSPEFRINANIYTGCADFLLRYMRQQRCGYNPFLRDSCHTHDGFIIYHPTRDSQHIDVTGGWHDASDYLQYVTTSASAVYQMLYAYNSYPEIFGDLYNASGDPESNGIPDIIDEAKWGLDWLLKMNPGDEEMYNQIADDRDHRGFRLPTLDTTSYGKGLERPVYLITGQPQGIYQHKNRTEGVASTAGKFASAFAIGSRSLREYFPTYCDTLLNKSFAAYKFGQKYPGVCQTAPCRAPYFYEEDNWNDDMELAAIELADITGAMKYYNDAAAYGKAEGITKWMGADTARHYQWYPFINYGHFLNAGTDGRQQKEFFNIIQQGLAGVKNRGAANPFFYGVPFIWCSNNLVSSAATQADMYQQISGDTTYSVMETSMRDWLFGCNPWGTSMICGLPAKGDYPVDPHSALSHYYQYPLDGGLIDGPVYTAIYKRLLGIMLAHDDQYKEFQSDIAVYHDDWGDYSTNEPTMDGTASLCTYFASLESRGLEQMNTKHCVIDQGGIIRKDTTEKKIYLIFSGHEYADGADTIISTLQKENVKASFFFTGDFYRNPNYAYIITELVNDGHYLGAHSDKHLLYCDWSKRDSLFVTQAEFLNDLRNNYRELERFGITRDKSLFYLPPYEWYNNQVSEWTNEYGLQIVNMTPGTRTNANYTVPSMANSYASSEQIIKYLKNKLNENPDSFKGAILLIHIGTSPERTDKLYNRLNEIISLFHKRGFSFGRF